MYRRRPRLPQMCASTPASERKSAPQHIRFLNYFPVDNLHQPRTLVSPTASHARSLGSRIFRCHRPQKYTRPPSKLSIHFCLYETTQLMRPHTHSLRNFPSVKLIVFHRTYKLRQIVRPIILPIAIRVHRTGCIYTVLTESSARKIVGSGVDQNSAPIRRLCPQKE